MCTTRQSLNFNNRFECVSYPSVDIAQISRGFAGPEQLWVKAVGSETELEEALIDYKKNKHIPGVIDLRISRLHNSN